MHAQYLEKDLLFVVRASVETDARVLAAVTYLLTDTHATVVLLCVCVYDIQQQTSNWCFAQLSSLMQNSLGPPLAHDRQV